MAKSKIVLDDEVLIDLTEDTIEPGTLEEGVTAHDASGEPITGTFTIREELTEQEQLIAQIAAALEGKAAGGGGGTVEDEELPAGYMRCSYIQFDGTQAVNTGVICDENTAIEVMFTRESGSSTYLYGVLSDGNIASVTAYLAGNGNWRFGSKSMLRGVTVSNSVVHTAIVDSSGIESAVGKTAYGSQTAFETIRPLLVGAGFSADGSIEAAMFVGKIMLFVMRSGEAQVLKLIPVTDGNGLYRFWDPIGREFRDSITQTPLAGGNF